MNNSVCMNAGCEKSVKWWKRDGALYKFVMYECFCESFTSDRLLKGDNWLVQCVWNAFELKYWKLSECSRLWECTSGGRRWPWKVCGLFQRVRKLRYEIAGGRFSGTVWRIWWRKTWFFLTLNFIVDLTVALSGKKAYSIIINNISFSI
jgi:hypothetical protein